MFNTITRRDFMKGMLVGGVAAGSAGLLAACGSSSSSSSTSSSSSSSSSESSSSSSEDTSSSSSEEVEEVVELTWGEQKAEEYTGYVETEYDLGGRTIVVDCVKTRYSAFVYATDDNGNIDVAGTSNDVLKTIGLLETIQEDYNCTIEFINCPQKTMPTLLITAMASGEPYGDLAYFGMTDTYMDTMYAAGVFQDLKSDTLKDIIGLDTNPWILGIDTCSFKAEQLGVPACYESGYTGVGSMVLYNKTLATQYGLPDLYELVNNNEWTWDKFKEILAMVKSAADDSVTPAVSEKYNQIFPGFAASNGTPYLSNVDGTVVWNGLSDPVLDSMNYIVDLIENGLCKSNDKGQAAMIEGSAVFDFGGFDTLKKISAGSLTLAGDWEFGLLPYPIGPSNTTGYNSEYYTTTTFSVLTGVEDPQGAAAVMMAIINRCGTTYEDWLDYCLESVVQDEESLDMIDIAAQDIIFDYCQAYVAIRSDGGLSAQWSLIQKLEATPKAAMESIDSQMQEAIESAYNYTPEEDETSSSS